MEKKTITFSANEQKLIKTGGMDCYASNTVAYIEAHFDLGENWDGYDSVRAVWWNDYNKTVATVLDSDGTCVVPYEVLTRKSAVKVNLVGSIAENDVLTDRLTTCPVIALTIKCNAKVDGDNAQPITPSQFEQFVAQVIAEVEKVTGMTAVAETLPAGSPATARYEDGKLYIGIPQGIQGETGNGIASVVLNSDYTLTLRFTDGTSYTTASIRGEVGPQGPKGDKGDTGDVSQEQLDAAVTDVKSDLDKFVTIYKPYPNVYNPTKEQKGALIDGSGNEVSNASYTLDADYIPATTGQYVSCYGADSSNKNGVAFVAYYDSNKTFIQRKSCQYGTVINFSIDPADVAYIRIIVWVDSTNVAVYINNTNPNYTSETFGYTAYGAKEAVVNPSTIPNYEDILTDLDYGYKTTDLTDIVELYTKAYVNTSGEFVNSTSWDAYLLQVSELATYSKITFKSYTNTTSKYQIAYYSSSVPTDETFISGEQFTVSSSLNTVDITSVPAGTVSLLLTNLSASGDISIVKTSAAEKSNIDINRENIETIDALSLRERRAKFDSQFNYIAYSAMMQSGKGPNSEEQYLWGAQRKFTAIKGDVRISSDNEIVMCHDEGFTLNGDGEVTSYDAENSTKIRDMTGAECFALVYEGTTDHVCGIDSLIRTCKLYGKIAFITVRSSYLDDIFPKIFNSLDKYSMRERAIINGFSYETMKKARKYDKNIMLSWVQNKNHQITTGDVDNANALGNCLITCYDYSGADETKASNQSDAVLAYARQKNIRIYEAIIGYDADLNNSVLFDRGFTGAQLAFEPQMFQYLP